jgi:hypothetical protein
MLSKTYFAILLFGFAWSVSAADLSSGALPKKAAFRIKNLITIRVPKDAKRVRMDLSARELLGQGSGALEGIASG